jgi:nitrite reductase/ring-hydroxylating ferredoxin subunit
VENLVIGRGKRFANAQVDIVLCMAESEIFALENRCPHAFSRLAGGRIEDGRLYCPWHGESFEICSGNSLGLYTTEPVRTYPVFIVNGDIEIEIAAQPADVEARP